MHSRNRAFAFSVVLAALSISAIGVPIPKQDKVLLRFKPEVGQKAKTKSQSTVKFDAMGQKLTIEESSTSATEVISADATHSVLRTVVESSKSTINGDPLPDDETEETVDITYAANGEIKEINIDPKPEEDSEIEFRARLNVGTSVVFSDQPVGAGDTWEKTYTPSDNLKIRAAKATFKFEAMEEIDGVACAKILMSYVETAGSPKMTATSTHWIELASGDSIKNEIKLSGVQIDFGFDELTTVAINGTAERSSGGLVKSDTNKEESPEDELGPIDEKVKDFEKIDGWAPIYRQEKEGRMTLYMELTADLFEKPMMLQATAASGLADGRVTPGEPISDLLFEFRKLPNEKIAMYVPNYLFRADSKLPIAKAVQRSFPDSMIETFGIEAEQDGKILIDLSNFFRGDISRLPELLAGGGNPFLGGGGSSLGLDRENSYVSEIKNFPNNTYVQAVLNFVGRGGGGIAELMGNQTSADDRSMIVKLNYNIYPLPMDNGYQPRMFDSRVGFFTSDYTDFNDSTALDDKVMMINRWNLVKKDPDAEMSEPVEPIVFWIDNSVPAEFRDSVKHAIESWNKAFEAAGFINAVVAKQMPDDADFDSADLRYNVVRWITSPSEAYAIALFRTNPLTGQILNGSVNVDANIVKIFAEEYGHYVRPEAWQSKLAKRLAAIQASHKDHPGECTLMEEGGLNAATGFIAAGLVPGLSRDEYINQFIKWVVTHEMGHMMGLRHNFVASTLLDLNNLGNAGEVDEEGTAASVMDYVAFNPSALKANGAKFYGDTVGRYDIHAIQYGYTVFPNKDSQDERYDLIKMAEKGTSEGLTWMGDEYADGIDPYVTRFDLGKDPLAYWSRMGDVSHDLLLKLAQNSPRQGQSYYNFTRDFNVLLGQYNRSASELTRFVGGVRKSPAYKGDPNAKPPVVNIDGATQKKALNQIVKMVFDAKAFEFPKDTFKWMALNPKGSFLETMGNSAEDFPMRDQFASIQASTLASLLEGGTLNRVMNAEYEAEKGESTLRLIDLFSMIQDAIWSETKTASAVSPLRRDLQRAHADILMSMVLEQSGASAEAVTIARWQLIKLSATLKTASKKTTDAYTQMHWDDLADRMDKALSARPTIGSSGGGGGLSLADLLGGAKPTKTGNGKSGG